MARSDVGLGGSVSYHLLGRFVPEGLWRRGREERGGDDQVARTKREREDFVSLIDNEIPLP
jgi:hypothetical protein